MKERGTHPLLLALQKHRGRGLEVLRESAEREHPLVRAVIAMQGSMSEGTPSTKDALEIAGRTPIENGGGGLALLFLVQWAYLCLEENHSWKAQALLDHAEPLVDHSTPLFLKLQVTGAPGILAHYRGDVRRREEVNRKCLRMARGDSGEYRQQLVNFAHLQAQRGLFADVESELVALGVSGPMPDLARFVGFTQAGRALEALEARFVFLPKLAASRLRLIAENQVLLGLMLGMGAKANASSRDQARNELLEESRAAAAKPGTWAMAASLLLGGRPEEALLQTRRMEADEPMRSLVGTDFKSYSLIRSELACGNAAAAQRILTMRREGGNVGYLDDLFLARIELLRGDVKAAGQHFRAVRESCRKYKATGRLEFELRLACEMSPGDMLRLMEVDVESPGETKPSPAKPVGRREGKQEPSGLIGESPAMCRVRQEIARMAPLDAAVLITGETGVGKELAARMVHESGSRSTEPFLAVNCGAIPDSLLESELFGHAKGAFTGAERARRGLFQEAGAGTILLDEIGEVSSRLQVALLRVLETGEIRPVGSNRKRKLECRVLAATNAPLEQLAEEGGFRSDLFYRLARFRIHIPPLRERSEDVAPLIHHFLNLDRADGKTGVMSDALIEELRRRTWRGNVRELRNEIERLRLLCSDKPVLELADYHGAGGPETRTPQDPEQLCESESGDAQPPSQQDQEPRWKDKRNPLSDHEVDKLVRCQDAAEQRLDRLRQLFLRHKKLRRGVVAKALAVSFNTATSDLLALCEEGLIEKVTPTRSRRTYHYRLREDPSVY